MNFLVDNAATIIQIAGTVFLCVVAVIALTPTKNDDEALKGFLAGISPTRKAVGGGALAGVIALAATLLGGCGMSMPSLESVEQIVREGCRRLLETEGSREQLDELDGGV
jgi:hypothetical protein